MDLFNDASTPIADDEENVIKDIVEIVKHFITNEDFHYDIFKIIDNDIRTKKKISNDTIDNIVKKTGLINSYADALFSLIKQKIINNKNITQFIGDDILN